MTTKNTGKTLKDLLNGFVADEPLQIQIGDINDQEYLLGKAFLSKGDQFKFQFSSGTEYIPFAIHYNDEVANYSRHPGIDECCDPHVLEINLNINKSKTL